MKEYRRNPISVRAIYESNRHLSLVEPKHYVAQHTAEQQMRLVYRKIGVVGVYCGISRINLYLTL